MKILLSEEQCKRLLEARIEGFRVDYLSSCGSFNKRVEYCKKMLGFPIGNGSSRMVFQLDDETCLKLAKNKKGIAQNMEEIRIASDNFISYIPKVFNGSDEENGLWIITQYVLPAKKSDFEETIGVSFHDISVFASNTDMRFGSGFKFLMKIADKVIDGLYEKYCDNDLAIELFNDMSEMRSSYDQCVGDLSRISNWGMVRENGKTYMVMLDSGLSEEVYEQFYK